MLSQKCVTFSAITNWLLQFDYLPLIINFQFNTFVQSNYLFILYSYSYKLLILCYKYSIENNKRQQFLHNRERKKWFAIIDTVLESSILVIKLDKQQDQLRIHQMNNITKEILQIHNDNDLRTTLRNLTYTRGSKLSGQDNKCTLEKHIRMMLQSNSASGSVFEFRKRGSQDKLINSLICQSNILENQFKVQIVNYWTDEQQMVIMASECLNNYSYSNQIIQLNYKIMINQS